MQVDLWTAQTGDADLDGSDMQSSKTAPLFAVSGHAAPSKNAGTPETINVEAGETFEVPVRLDRAATLGAYGLALEYPFDKVSFQGAEGPRSSLQSQTADGTVRLSWFDRSGGEEPIEVQAGREIVTLTFRAAADLGGSTNLELEMAEGELADAQGRSIDNATLTVPKFTLGTPAPDEFALKGNYPNPFRGRTQLRVDLPSEATVNVAVYNVLGQRVLQVEKAMDAGRNRALPLDASRLSSGTFFYRVRAEVDGKTVKETGQMVQVR